MRRKKNSLRREKIIMISASAFVLTALTMAGVYVREQSKANDEYRVDLSQLDGQTVAEKTDEINENLQLSQNNVIIADDLDADPNFWEVDSPEVENDFEVKTDEKVTAQQAGENITAVAEDNESEELAQTEETLEAGAENVIAPNYNFPGLMQMQWPLYGDLIMNYSMDKTVYFETLGQYRYNPALVIKAGVGDKVKACANGVVTEVYQSTELGNVVVMDIGDGYELTYGQLEDITVVPGNVIETGTLLGTVAEPSVYYTSEGSNLYLKMTKDGAAVNPMDVLP
ncbi:MAG: M23 family metallopeptidase [Lachnospiraceae bacterium]|nr:M23 family metallopeptidase [Lachnospiraceae bacterium]